MKDPEEGIPIIVILILWEQDTDGVNGWKGKSGKVHQEGSWRKIALGEVEGEVGVGVPVGISETRMKDIFMVAKDANVGEFIDRMEEAIRITWAGCQAKAS